MTRTRLALVTLLALACVLLFPATHPAAQTTAPAAAGKTFTLTVHVEGVNNEGGNIGVLVFQNDKGWPEDRLSAFKDVVVPAHPGTVTVTVTSLPPGTYALAVAHDANKN